MSGSCHLDRASNVEIGVECQIFVIVIFFNCLQFGDYLRYYKGALTQKRSFLAICTTFRFDFHVCWKNQNKHSTLNSSINALSKWHEPDISYQKILTFDKWHANGAHFSHFKNSFITMINTLRQSLREFHSVKNSLWSSGGDFPNCRGMKTMAIIGISGLDENSAIRQTFDINFSVTVHQ